jgi:hypothetical protein
MGELSGAATLELWDAAHALRPVERAVALACADGEDADDVAQLPLGRRDERLLALHAAVAGSAIEATASCPHCGESAEFSLDVDDLLVRGAEAVPAPEGWRSPNSRDLEAAEDALDADAAERVLLERCVGGGELTDEARRAVAAAMAEADPLAEVLVDVACPGCGTTFVAELDVSAFVWAEVRAAALALLRDVDVLARAYGWTEAEVLALGEGRRQAYLELVSEDPA